MPGKFKINALIVLALGALFFIFFSVTKHDPLLSPANPFGEDPFDAVGSFGVQVAAILGLLSLLRALWPVRGSGPTLRRSALLLRTQMLALLCAVVTLAADLVAMARYPSVWLNAPGGRPLAALLGGLLALAVAAGAWIYQPVRGLGLTPEKGDWRRAAMVCGASGLILAVYPDAWRASIPGALFTVLVGATLLVAPMWAVSVCLVPYPPDDRAVEPGGLAGWFRRNRLALGLVVLLGIGMGGALVLAEMVVEGGSPDLLKRAFVVAVYVGLETAGLLIGYAFLHRPLGLFPSKS